MFWTYLNKDTFEKETCSRPNNANLGFWEQPNYNKVVFISPASKWYADKYDVI